MKWIALFALLFVGAASANVRFVLNTKRLSDRKVAITCTNGGDPTGTMVGNTLIIDCGK